MNEQELAAAKEDLLRVASVISKIGGRVTDASELMKSRMADFCSKARMGEVVDTGSEIIKAFQNLEEDMKKLRGEISKMKEVHMPARFDDEGVTTFNTDRFRVTRSARVFASIISEDKDDAFQWLRDNEYGGLIKPTVNASSLSAAAKEMLENGMELPDDMFRVATKDNVSITVKNTRG